MPTASPRQVVHAFREVAQALAEIADAAAFGGASPAVIRILQANTEDIAAVRRLTAALGFVVALDDIGEESTKRW